MIALGRSGQTGRLVAGRGSRRGPRSLADRRLGESCQEIVHLAVAPGAQGRGVGRLAHGVLIAGCPAPTAVLGVHRRRTGQAPLPRLRLDGPDQLIPHPAMPARLLGHGPHALTRFLAQVTALTEAIQLVAWRGRPGRRVRRLAGLLSLS